jgi:hypothetical protein
MRVRKAAAVLIVLAALSGCAGRSELRRGHIVLGFETSSFQPCGDAERWWLSGDMDVMHSITLADRALDPSSQARLYAELRGVLSREGSFGHLGGYPREFHVTEVVEARPESAQDCASPLSP